MLLFSRASFHFRMGSATTWATGWVKTARHSRRCCVGGGTRPAAPSWPSCSITRPESPRDSTSTKTGSRLGRADRPLGKSSARERRQNGSWRGGSTPCRPEGPSLPSSTSMSHMLLIHRPSRSPRATPGACTTERDRRGRRDRRGFHPVPQGEGALRSFHPRLPFRPRRGPGRPRGGRARDPPLPRGDPGSSLPQAARLRSAGAPRGTAGGARGRAAHRPPGRGRRGPGEAARPLAAGRLRGTRRAADLQRDALPEAALWLERPRLARGWALPLRARPPPRALRLGLGPRGEKGPLLRALRSLPRDARRAGPDEPAVPPTGGLGPGDRQEARVSGIHLRDLGRRPLQRPSAEVTARQPRPSACPAPRRCWPRSPWRRETFPRRAG